MLKCILSNVQTDSHSKGSTGEQLWINIFPKDTLACSMEQTAPACAYITMLKLQLLNDQLIKCI